MNTFEIVVQCVCDCIEALEQIVDNKNNEPYAAGTAEDAINKVRQTLANTFNETNRNVP
jgi:hypothetical protein